MTTGESGSSVPEWNLADRLRKIRRDRHLTQEKIAAELGYKPGAWAAWEADRTHPQDVLGLAVAIERRYGVPAAWTLGVLGGVDRRRGEVTPKRGFHRRWTDPPMFNSGQAMTA